MKCAIMQPTYLPWSGYFNLITSVDRFYYLDDAQYERSSWHNRNRILLDGKIHWLTIPVTRNFLGQKLNEVICDPLQTNWRKKHSDSIRYAYKRCKYSKDLNTIIDIIENEKQPILADFTIALIEEICILLEITTPRYRSSQKVVDMSRSKKIIELCNQVGCNEYLSPQGAKEYLIEDGFADLSDISLSFQDFQTIAYLQPKTNEFISHLSIIDVIANLGIKSTKDYIQSRYELDLI